MIIEKDSLPYILISQHYGERKAERSGVRLMNHIDEGLFILSELGFGAKAQEAFCLHPLLQSDEDLEQTQERYRLYSDKPGIGIWDMPRWTLVLAMEYRSVANEYLSTRHINFLSEIRLSPLAEVNQMLIADKLQNYKDFLIYHKDTHPRSKELDQYFWNWFKRLNLFDGKELKPEYARFLMSETYNEKD